MKKDITSLRSTLEFQDATGELVTTDVEVDPHLEKARKPPRRFSSNCATATPRARCADRITAGPGTFDAFLTDAR